LLFALNQSKEMMNFKVSRTAGFGVAERVVVGFLPFWKVDFGKIT